MPQILIEPGSDVLRSTHDPFVSSMAEYDACCEAVVREAARDPGLAAVYLMGSQWVPGISDIDLVVVYRGERPPDLAAPEVVSEAAAQLVTHQPLCMHQQDFEQFYYLFPKVLNDLKLLWGEAQTIEDPASVLSHEDFKIHLCCCVVDGLVNRYLRFPLFAESYKRRREETRKLIHELHGITHLVTLTEAATGVSLGVDYTARIKGLRKRWFQLSAEQQGSELDQLLDRAVDLVVATIEQLDRHLTGRQLPDPGHFSVMSKRYTLHFADNWDKPSYLDALHGEHVKTVVPLLGWKLENYSFLLPASFRYFIAAQAAGQGLFSAALRSSTVGSVIAPSIANPGIERSVATRNSHLYRLVSNDLPHRTPFSYGISPHYARSARFAMAVRAVVRLNRRFRLRRVPS